MSTGIVWFRRDLRLDDNPAWAAATAAHQRVIAAFVIDPALWDRCHPSRIAMLAANLRALDQRVTAAGGRLWLGRGEPIEEVRALAHRHRAEAVHANRDVSPFATRRDLAAVQALPMVWWDGQYVHAPGRVLTKSGEAFTVFTPFHRRWSELDWNEWPEPGDAQIVDAGEPEIPATSPPPIEGGEIAALQRLEGSLDRIEDYPDERDRPDLDTTSRLSIDLKWGTISARTIVDTVGSGTKARAAFIRQIAWRDFYAQVMEAIPHTAERAMKPKYDAVPWIDDPDAVTAWKSGHTGYPIVDAGMRQLLAEGWMHNRVRMIAASFLVKDLLVDWRVGELHFRRLLLDADVSQNVGNWQWVAGTGADAAPYFRIFNPTTQSRKFDPDGVYIRRWVPELRSLAGSEIHAPGPADLVGLDYPAPIVDHALARQRTLAAYGSVSG
ncbi:MAG: DNA photolyase family protein [Acidimicrobiia bacterium]|nr:DNA photolyase family protein [Acidimicrobiia bacterium]